MLTMRSVSTFPMSNRGGQSWDFAQRLGHGAFALALLREPDIKKIDFNRYIADVHDRMAQNQLVL